MLMQIQKKPRRHPRGSGCCTGAGRHLRIRWRGAAPRRPHPAPTPRRCANTGIQFVDHAGSIAFAFVTAMDSGKSRHTDGLHSQGSKAERRHWNGGGILWRACVSWSSEVCPHECHLDPHQTGITV